MPSSDKTTNIGLNRWRGSDTPVRQDFVDDNEILDSVINNIHRTLGSEDGNADARITAHLADSAAHLTPADRNTLNAAAHPPVIGSYTGDGQVMQVISLGFRPQFGFVLAVGQPLIEPGANGLFQVSRSALLTNQGGSRGIEGTTTGFRVTQNENSTATGSDQQGLNRQHQIYAYVMWR